MRKARKRRNASIPFFAPRWPRSPLRARAQKAQAHAEGTSLGSSFSSYHLDPRRRGVGPALPPGEEQRGRRRRRRALDDDGAALPVTQHGPGRCRGEAPEQRARRAARRHLLLFLSSLF